MGAKPCSKRNWMDDPSDVNESHIRPCVLKATRDQGTNDLSPRMSVTVGTALPITSNNFILGGCQEVRSQAAGELHFLSRTANTPG